MKFLWIPIIYNDRFNLVLMELLMAAVKRMRHKSKKKFYWDIEGKKYANAAPIRGGSLVTD